MSNDLDALVTKLRALRVEWDDDVARAAYEKHATSLDASQRARLLQLVFDDDLAYMAAAGDAVIHPQGTVNVSDDARINGVAVGVNLGRIVYGRDLEEDERRQLVWYLARLANRLARLPLRGMAARLDDGQGVALPKVYMMTAINGLAEIGYSGSQSVLHYFQQNGLQKILKPEYTLDWALPAVAVASVAPVLSSKETEGDVVLLRLRLATESVREHPRLVLLGDPGAGKSMFLRHLAWALAVREMDQRGDKTVLFGWDDDTYLLPVLLPLRKLAMRITTADANVAAVSAALRDEMTREYDVRQADALLDKALAGGTALLLFDGLDEVPLVATPGVIADRLTTLQAVRAFAELHGAARVVLTCRTRAFTEALCTCLDWPTKTIASFTLGQIRHFVVDWFATLIERGWIARGLGEANQATLIDAIVRSKRLRAMAENPLLLTMMAIILTERGELPRDRPLLYEHILEQLLGQWDQQKGGQSLTDIIGAPNLHVENLRAILDELSYKAHASATERDGRGRLVSKDLRYALAEFLEKMQVAGAWEAAGQCLVYFIDRSGLLVTEDDGAVYAFAHLTLQEHCAGRHMLLAPNAIELVMQHRGEDHWREPIALGLGVVQKLYAPLADRIDRILTELIDPDERGIPKPRERWYRDLILAAELGQERDWSLLRALINVDRLQRDLRRGLVTLLQDQAQPLPIAERVRAGFLLGDLGDPRFPVTIDEWRREIASTRGGRTDGYFCQVPLSAGDAAFWIARYPITNAQLREWMHTTQLPPRRHETDANFNHPNQPAAGVNWYLASEFCAWLSQQAGVMIRLPSEVEWEAAARGPNGRRYPWGDKRLRDRAATKEDHDLRAWPYTIPVGCYPAGASAIGALDMVGNTWEWTSDVWQSDKESALPQTDGQKRTLRGGGYLSRKKQMLATAHIGLPPGVGFDNGFRVVLEIHDGSFGD